MTEQERRDELTRCWHANVGRVRAYATRHVGADAAADVAAETFLAAWRRWDDVPDPALPWLLGTARKVIANRRRGERRHQELTARVALLDGAARPDSVPGIDRLVALEALALLPDPEREALLLVSWDGLTPAEAAAALGIRPGTLRVRIHRARARLTATLADHATTEEISCPTTS